MGDALTCPACGKPAEIGPVPSRTGSERGRPYQYVRREALYFSCPEHGPYSVAEETIEGERVDVAVIRNDSNPDTYWTIRY